MNRLNLLTGSALVACAIAAGPASAQEARDYNIRSGTLRDALNAFAAVRGVDRMLLVKARALGARPHQVYLKVVVPAALPTVVVGLRLGATYAFVGIVATEMISSFDGIGYLLGYYTLLFQSGKTYGYILVALLLAFALNATLRAIETRAGRWR